MKITVDERMFRDKFIDYSREDNFSREGLSLLFEYLEQLEEDTGEEMELDVISLCCDYSELTFQEVAKEYSLTLEETEDEGEEVTYNWETMNDDQLEEVVKEYLEENTCVVGFTDTTVVYLNF